MKALVKLALVVSLITLAFSFGCKKEEAQPEVQPAAEQAQPADQATTEVAPAAEDQAAAQPATTDATAPAADDEEASN